MQQQKGSSIYKTKFLSTQLLLYYDAIITNCTYKTTKQPHNRTSVPHTVLCTVLFQIQKEGLLYLYYLSLLHELLQESLEWNKPKSHLTVKNQTYVRSSRPVRRSSNPRRYYTVQQIMQVAQAGRSRLYPFITRRMILSAGICRRWRERNICSG